MTSSVLGMIKEEVTCPICLDLMVEPVNVDCGHSFCRACIKRNYESSKGKEEEGICPVCQLCYMFGNLRPNRHVANIVERLTGFKSSPEEEQKVNVCAQHGEKLQLFCENDMVAICWLCERSQEHRGHQTDLIEEVAHEYKEKLQTALQEQMAKEKRCDEWENDLQEERTFWKNQIQGDVEKVQNEFKELQEFLNSKEKNEVQKLKQEEEDIMNSLAESQSELVKQRESVRALISDLEHQLQCSTMEMMQGVNSVLKRSQTLRLKQPEMVPRKQRRIFRAPDLKGMLQVFQGLMDAQQYWVHVTLNQVHNENIAVNEDKRQIQHRNNSRRNLQISETYGLGVLGYPALHSGKHYWEVDVSRNDAWLLGLNDGKCAQPQLCALNEKGIKVQYNFNVKQHILRQPTFTFGSQSYFDFNFKHDYQPTYAVKDNSNVKQHVNYQPKYGYWVIGMKNGSIYNAFEECSVTHNASVLVLSLTRRPSRVGVFLDREACTLSFYDVSNHGALIYRFCEPSFPDEVYPYFNPMSCLEPMTVCGPPS
ncbi:tripartite motif-containing protein 30A-like isoform X2 [Peromyscus maniculatus bairdii]|uniref:tripartite motif-containing protein 30A-like isoform X2 n=1 Tax=Peromyscus maniculatus bairdii TaxID=230844 RepID=UPI001C2F01D0|nr:tripartite motif-containing protein 30A-like [Peromyscus maniculatus bairdii]XP_042137104.1 tripartite motif-containing protein 30A-like [Peromyscus maniculatus bairdii]